MIELEDLVTLRDFVYKLYLRESYHLVNGGAYQESYYVGSSTAYNAVFKELTRLIDKERQNEAEG